MCYPNRYPAAWAQVRGEGIYGMVHFYPAGEGTLVTADIHGLPDNGTGFFAFHVHAGPGCEAPGGHFDPGGQPHPDHAGDLPPLLSDGGHAFLAVRTGRFRPSDVTGRAVILHAGPDDFHTQPSGNPGPIIACGEIRSAEVPKM